MNRFDLPHLSADSKVAEIIQQNPYLLLLLDHFEIQLPVQEKNIACVCAEKKISTNLFLTFANLFNRHAFDSSKTISIPDVLTIVEYLKNSHKYYSNEIYPSISKIIDDLISQNNNTEVGLVKKFFIEYFNEVTEHLDYENRIVFPYVLNLYEKIKDKTKINTIPYSVKEYKEKHNDIEEKLEDLKHLLIKYLPEQKDKLIRRKLLFSLDELEYDLAIHSKIEDMILIPLVSLMEETLKDGNK